RTRGASTRTAPVYDPAAGAVQREVALADITDVDAAVAAAAEAFPAWSELSVSRRQRVLFRARDLLEQRVDELAAIITSEHGKVLRDAARENTRGLEGTELASGFPQPPKSEYCDNVRTSGDADS